MSKFDLLNTEMKLSEARAHIAEIRDNLDTIYLAPEAPSGVAGTVWQQFWGNPRQITPLTLYLREMIGDEIATSQEMLKQQAKELKSKAKNDIKLKVENVKQLNLDTVKYAESLITEHEELVERSTKEHKELRRLQLIQKAQKRPSMLEAQARDIRSLIERLKVYTTVDFQELESYRLQQEIKEVTYPPNLRP